MEKLVANRKYYITRNFYEVKFYFEGYASWKNNTAKQDEM